MKQFFMVNNDVKFIDEQNEWMDVSEEDLLGASQLDEKLKRVKLFASFDDARTAALDGVDFDTETNFFPIFAVDVPDNVKGRKVKYYLEDGSKLSAISIDPDKISDITAIYLDHIDDSYENIHYEQKENESSEEQEFEEELEVLNEKPAAPVKAAEEEKPAAAVEVAKEDKPAQNVAGKPNRLAAISQYVPSPKAVLKNGLMIGATGAAYYFGNEAVVNLAANAGVVVPTMLATSAALPLVAGTATRLAVEVPELAATGVKLAANSKAAAKVSEKAAPVVARTAPYIPSTKNLVKNGLAVAAGALAFYFGNTEVASLVAQTGFALPEVLTASALLPAAVVASARLVTELPELSLKAASFVSNRGSQLIEAGKAKWHARTNAAPSKAPVSPEASEAKERLKKLTEKAPSNDEEIAFSADKSITLQRDKQAAERKQAAAEAKKQAMQTSNDLTKEPTVKVSLH